MQNKMKKVNFRISEELWELGKMKIGENMSKFLREQIRTYVNNENTEKELEKQIRNKEQELTVLRQKLNDIHKTNILLGKIKEDPTRAINAINRVHTRLGQVGMNHIAYFSNTWSIPQSELIDYCQKNKIKITNYA